MARRARVADVRGARAPTWQRGGAWAIYDGRRKPYGPFRRRWATGPEYVAGDDVLIEEDGDDVPWQADVDAGSGLAPFNGDPRTMGSLVDVLDGLLSPGWGTVAITAIIAGATGIVIGIVIGEGETAKAFGRGLSGVVEKGSGQVARAGLRALVS